MLSSFLRKMTNEAPEGAEMRNKREGLLIVLWRYMKGYASQTHQQLLSPSLRSVERMTPLNLT